LVLEHRVLGTEWVMTSHLIPINIRKILQMSQTYLIFVRAAIEFSCI